MSSCEVRLDVLCLLIYQAFVRTSSLAQKLQAALADTQRAGHLDQDIALDIDVHKSDGSFLNELLEWEFASVYANTTNVVARLSPASWLSASPDREKGERASGRADEHERKKRFKDRMAMFTLIILPRVVTTVTSLSLLLLFTFILFFKKH